MDEDEEVVLQKPTNIEKDKPAVNTKKRQRESKISAFWKKTKELFTHWWPS